MTDKPFQEGTSQLDAVQEDDSSIVTAARAVITIIEDPLLSILKENLHKTHSAG